MQRAEEGIKNQPLAPKKVQPKSIDEYNKELKKKTLEKEKTIESGEKKLFYTKNNKLR